MDTRCNTWSQTEFEKPVRKHKASLVTFKMRDGCANLRAHTHAPYYWAGISRVDKHPNWNPNHTEFRQARSTSQHTDTANLIILRGIDANELENWGHQLER